jgi:uncharacterized membrane protein
MNIVQALLIGFVAGLRTLVAPAAVMIALRLPGAWIAAALALFEMYGDKSPKAPARTVPPSLIARILFGGASAFLLALYASGRPWSMVLKPWPAAALGMIGALAGTYGGYQARRALTRPGLFPDFAVALGEDAIAVILAYLVVTL